SIQGGPTAAKAGTAAPAKGAAGDVAADDIDSWLVSDGKNPAPERPSGVYSGDTITIAAFKDGQTPAAEAKKVEDDDEYERQGDDEEESADDDSGAEEEGEEVPEDFIDESNPFHVKKKPQAEQAPTKPVYKDTSDAASDILRKMMERRRNKG